jgi:L-ribulose-5-phosphate 3-epimerase
MTGPISRREFLARTAAGATVLSAAPTLTTAADDEPLFKISLAQWSLHRAFGRRGKGTLDPLRFAEISKNEYGIDAVEYVNQFYATKKKDDAYLKDLKKVADDAGVKSVLIMCDGEGALGDPDEGRRKQAVENHHRWVEWAKFLGCHSIRVNAQTNNVGSFEEQQKRAADGLRKLTEWAADNHGIAVIVENHGGLSSHGQWLAGVMKLVDHKMCGTLPDFGNFRISAKEEYDRYKGVDELMPYAKGVSAKSHDFDEQGNEIHTDYRRMMDIVVRKHKYRGYVGIEYEGNKLSEPDGIRATKKLLETVRAEMAKG